MDSTTGLDVTIPASFCEQPDMPHVAFRLFVYLRYCANSTIEKNVVYQSYDNIEQMTGISRKSISKGVKWLEAHGWLKRKKRFSESAVYTITVPNL